VIIAALRYGGSVMRATLRPSTDGHARVTRPPAALDSQPAPPPLIRRFPSEASPTEPAGLPLLLVGASTPQGAGAELWYAVFLSAFLIGLLVLGGFWIWLNIRFL
jgi:hypothetical protein